MTDNKYTEIDLNRLLYNSSKSSFSRWIRSSAADICFSREFCVVILTNKLLSDRWWIPLCRPLFRIGIRLLFWEEFDSSLRLSLDEEEISDLNILNKD